MQVARRAFAVLSVAVRFIVSLCLLFGRRYTFKPQFSVQNRGRREALAVYVVLSSSQSCRSSGRRTLLLLLLLLLHLQPPRN